MQIDGCESFGLELRVLVCEGANKATNNATDTTEQSLQDDTQFKLKSIHVIILESNYVPLYFVIILRLDKSGVQKLKCRPNVDPKKVTNQL